MTTYVYALMASLIFGVVMAFVVIYLCVELGVDLTQNIWVIAIPAILAVIFNVCFLEYYARRKKK